MNTTVNTHKAVQSGSLHFSSCRLQFNNSCILRNRLQIDLLSCVHPLLQSRCQHLVGSFVTAPLKSPSSGSWHTHVFCIQGFVTSHLPVGSLSLLASHCLQDKVQLLRPAFKAYLSSMASALTHPLSMSSQEQPVPCPSRTLASVPFLDEILMQFEERNSLPESPQQVLGASLSVS